MIDPFHLEAYGVTTVNYNRDVEIFPVLQAMFTQIYGESPYKSPTDMGVNMVGNCIIDDDAVRAAAKQEIIRRYYTALCDKRIGYGSDEIINKIRLVMKQAQISPEDRPVVKAALDRAESTGNPAVAIELNDGRIITGKTSDLLGAASAALLNALKALGSVPKEKLLMAPEVIEPICHLKTSHLGGHNPRLHTDEVLIALSICATQDGTAECAMEQLSRLAGCEAHSTVILSPVDRSIYNKLGIRLTCEPMHQTKKLYHRA